MQLEGILEGRIVVDVDVLLLIDGVGLNVIGVLGNKEVVDGDVDITSNEVWSVTESKSIDVCESMERKCCLMKINERKIEFIR